MGTGSGSVLAYRPDGLLARMQETSGASFLDRLKRKRRKPGTDWLLLTCMDYRLTRHTARYMERRRLTAKFDHIVLASASLGATCPDVPEWNATFWAHLNAAMELHDIKTVILMDHTDCGAYKLFLKDRYPPKKKQQVPVHAETLNALGNAIVGRFPHLKVEKHIMHVTGKVIDVTP